MFLFDKNYIHFNSINSTNEFMLSLKGNSFFKEGLIVTADHQKNGKTLNKGVWNSEKNKNILISILIQPNISLNKQFDLTKLISIVVYELILDFNIKSDIKWPNDILVKNRKIAGILIQNIVSNNRITHSILGLGLNVNQTNFKRYNVSPTSMKLELRKDIDCKNVVERLLNILEHKLEKYRSLKSSKFLDYKKRLFLLNRPSRYEFNNKRFFGIIKGVDDNGLLKIEKNGVVEKFDQKQLKFIL